MQRGTPSTAEEKREEEAEGQEGAYYEVHQQPPLFSGTFVPAFCLPSTYPHPAPPCRSGTLMVKPGNTGASGGAAAAARDDGQVRAARPVGPHAARVGTGRDGAGATADHSDMREVSENDRAASALASESSAKPAEVDES